MTIYGCIIEDNPAPILLRFSVGNALATQAAVSSITWEAFDMADNSSAASGTLTVTDVVFDTLQTSTDDIRWTGSSTGFNFRHVVPASTFPTGGKRYLIEHRVTPTSGDAFNLDAAVITVVERYAG